MNAVVSRQSQVSKQQEQSNEESINRCHNHHFKNSPYQLSTTMCCYMICYNHHFKNSPYQLSTTMCCYTICYNHHFKNSPYQLSTTMCCYTICYNHHFKNSPYQLSTTMCCYMIQLKNELVQLLHLGIEIELRQHFHYFLVSFKLLRSVASATINNSCTSTIINPTQ